MFTSFMAAGHSLLSSKSFKWTAATIIVITTLFWFMLPSYAGECGSCSASVSAGKVGGVTKITSGSHVSLQGIGNAYSQSSGVGSIKATASATPGNPLSTKATSSGSVDGVTFTVGSGNYTGSSTFNGSAVAGGKATADYASNGINLGAKSVADSGYFSGVGGAKASLSSTNGQGAAGGASTKATSVATASATKSLAECATDLLGKGNTDIFTEAGGYGNGVIVDGVMLAPGAGNVSAGSTADAKATFSVK